MKAETKFIELTGRNDGKKHLINLDDIIDLKEDSNGVVVIVRDLDKTVSESHLSYSITPRGLVCTERYSYVHDKL